MSELNESFLDPFLEQTRKEAARIRREEARAEREKRREERERLDYEHETEQARQKVIALRKTTLAIAWAAAELLNQSDAKPDHWLYTQRPAGFFGRKAVQGIAATGWPLLAWRSTRYAPAVVNRLILTPTSVDNKGTHLSYFAERLPRSGEQADELLPQDVSPLPAEPRSPEDMPWPVTWTSDVGDGGIMTTNERDDEYEIQRMLARFKRENDPDSYQLGERFKYAVIVGGPSEQDRAKEIEIRMLRKKSIAQQALRSEAYASPHGYEKYAKSGVEDAMRRSIAIVAAQHLHIAPERAARRLAERAALGIEERQE